MSENLDIIMLLIFIQDQTAVERKDILGDDSQLFAQLSEDLLCDSVNKDTSKQLLISIRDSVLWYNTNFRIARSHFVLISSHRCEISYLSVSTYDDHHLNSTWSFYAKTNVGKRTVSIYYWGNDDNFTIFEPNRSSLLKNGGFLILSFSYCFCERGEKILH